MRLGRLLADVPLDLIVSSNLGRARATADACARRGHRLVPRISDGCFQEMDFGNLEGVSLESINLVYDETTAAWDRGEVDAAWPGVNGESCADVAARGLRGLHTLGLLPPPRGRAVDVANRPKSRLKDALSRARWTTVRGPPQQVLLVAHGRFNKILIAALLGDASKCNSIKQGNACLNVIDLDPTTGKVVVQALDVRTHLLDSRESSAGPRGAGAPRSRLSMRTGPGTQREGKPDAAAA